MPSALIDYSLFLPYYSIFVFSKFLRIILIILPIISSLNTIHRAPNRFLLYAYPHKLYKPNNNYEQRLYCNITDSEYIVLKR